MSAPVSRIYAVFPKDHELLTHYQSRDFDALRSFLASRLGCDMNFHLELPSSNWSLEGVDKLIISIKFPSDDPRSDSLERMALHTEEAAFANVPITVADHWCPSNPDQLLFGTRRAARKLIDADALGTPPLSGKGVNVVIIDRG